MREPLAQGRRLDVVKLSEQETRAGVVKRQSMRCRRSNEGEVAVTSSSGSGRS